MIAHGTTQIRRGRVVGDGSCSHWTLTGSLRSPTFECLGTRPVLVHVQARDSPALSRDLGSAAGKAITGKALANPVLRAEGRVTLVDACLATAVLVGLTLNAALGWWWADPLAGLVIVGYAIREARLTLGFDAAAP